MLTVLGIRYSMRENGPSCVWDYRSAGIGRVTGLSGVLMLRGLWVCNQAITGPWRGEAAMPGSD
jgi:hypothetical protein